MSLELFGKILMILKLFLLYSPKELSLNVSFSISIAEILVNTQKLSRA
jgi:hypothetical protein